MLYSAALTLAAPSVTSATKPQQQQRFSYIVSAACRNGLTMLHMYLSLASRCCRQLPCVDMQSLNAHQSALPVTAPPLACCCTH